MWVSLIKLHVLVSGAIDNDFGEVLFYGCQHALLFIVVKRKRNFAPCTVMNQ